MSQSSEIIPIKTKRIVLNKLYVRYIPVVTPLKLWNYDMLLKNSPHVGLMKIFKKHGLRWDKIKNSRYYKERVHRFKIGLFRWNKSKIEKHIKKRYEIWKSVKGNGYRKRICKNDPIKVLKRPFWETRFGREGLEGPEIWNGAGRCAALYVLGKKDVEVLIVKDAKPGTGDKGKFGDKLKNVKNVF